MQFNDCIICFYQSIHYAVYNINLKFSYFPRWSLFLRSLKPCDLLYITKSHNTILSLCTHCNNHIILTFLLFKYTKITCNMKRNRTVFYFKYKQHSMECMWRQRGVFVYDSKVTRGKGEAHVALY